MKLALLSLAALAVSACAADRLQWNLAHTNLYGGAQLSHSDFEQIVTLATQLAMHHHLSFAASPGTG